MARSQHIWAVVYPLPENTLIGLTEFVTIFAVFTVKHECATWCEKHIDIFPNAADNLQVWRYNDGQPAGKLRTEFGTIRQFLESEFKWTAETNLATG